MRERSRGPTNRRAAIVESLKGAADPSDSSSWNRVDDGQPVKLTLTLPLRQASWLVERARASGVSYGAYLASMIDGEPRFATCLAVEPVMVAVLTRENLARIIVEQPMLGAKILMELVLMLSQRLRTTSGRLLQLIDEQSHRATNLL